MIHAMKAFEAVAARPIDGEEFRAIVRDIQDGKRVSQQELADACVYAKDSMKEYRALTEALCSGWQIAMDRLNFKNQRIGRLERQLKAERRKLFEKAKDGSTDSSIYSE